VWTQFALGKWSGEDSLGIATYHEASAKLVGWGYHFTSLNVDIIARAGKLAGWDPDAWPFKQALDSFSLEEVPIELNARLALEVVRMVWRCVSTEQVCQRLTMRVLDRLSRLKRGREAIESMLSVIDKAFGLDVVTAGRVKDVTRNWLRGSAGLIIP